MQIDLSPDDLHRVAKALGGWSRTLREYWASPERRSMNGDWAKHQDAEADAMEALEKRFALWCKEASAPATEPPSETYDRAPTPDEAAGMAWWNELTVEQRRHWSRAAGDTGRAVDCWNAYKRRNNIA